MKQAFRTHDGRTLAYRREGDGPLLVCHPGGPGFSSKYLVDLGGLGKHRTLILLDPRGTGGSDAPADARAYETGDYVADVDELRAHLGLERVDLLGHSHGGVVAAAYAAEHPATTGRVVLADTLTRLQPEEMESLMQTRTAEPWYEDARDALEREQAGEFDNQDELRALVRREMPFYFADFDTRAETYRDTHLTEIPNQDALKLFNEDIETWDMRADLARIDAPTLVLTGEVDFICGPACAQDFVVGIRGVQRVLLENCGHFPFVEQPQAFCEAVDAFLG